MYNKILASNEFKVKIKHYDGNGLGSLNVLKWKGAGEGFHHA